MKKGNWMWRGMAEAMRRLSMGSLRRVLRGMIVGGDGRWGQSLVVWAINEGRGAARECDRYLMGETDLP